MAEWFRRQSEKIKTNDRKEIAEGLWLKCPQCREVVYRKMLEDNFYMCTSCNHHFRINSKDYIQLLLDNANYDEIAKDIQSTDPLNFEAEKFISLGTPKDYEEFVNWLNFFKKNEVPML